MEQYNRQISWAAEEVVGRVGITSKNKIVQEMVESVTQEARYKQGDLNKTKNAFNNKKLCPRRST